MALRTLVGPTVLALAVTATAPSLPAAGAPAERLVPER